jgi:hypothetical protein
MLADFRSQGGDKWDELNHRARARRWAADGATGGHPLGLADAGPRRASSSVEVHARFAAR